MPSNVNIVNESDTASFSNDLTPTDGYFNQGPAHPQDILVPDPSQAVDESRKPSEAHVEHENGTSTPRFEYRRVSSTTRRSLPGRRTLDPDFEDETNSENSPLRSLAPPTYSAATASSQNQSSRLSDHSSTDIEGSRYYNTMGNHGLFTTYAHPISLSNPAQSAPLLGVEAAEQRSWWQKARACILSSMRGLVKIFCILVMVLLGVGLIAKAFFSTHNHDLNPIHTSPKHGLDDFPSGGLLSCPSGIHTSRKTYRFKEPSAFTFAQLVSSVKFRHGDTYRRVHTSGELHVRPATELLGVGVRLDVEMRYSEYGMMEGTGFEPKLESFSIYTPSHITVDSATSSNPCVFLVATIWLQPGVCLDFLDLGTQSMSVSVHEGLDMITNAIDVHVAGAGSVEFPHGSGTLANIDPRKIVITTISGSVSGTFPLFDLLRIISRSGTIRIDVEPKEALLGNPQPAQLSLSTVSGAIQVSSTVFSSDQTSIVGSIPARDYQNDIQSVSGSLAVTLLHGSKLRMKSVSGSIKALLSPYDSVEERSYITAGTRSGSIDFTVLSSILHPEKPIRKLYGVYQPTSGSLHIQYPREWEGKVKGKTLTGTITVYWPGLNIGRGSGEHGVWRTLDGYKGDGEGTLTFDSRSGSVTLRG